MSEFLILQTEMIECEFKGVDFEILNNIVMDLVFQNKNYMELNNNDRFDYLVDSILNLMGCYNV